MVDDKYTINGRVYNINIDYLKEDDLYEISLISEEGKILVSEYGETRGEAYREMERRLKDLGVKPGVDNKISTLTQEDKRKIKVYLKGLKTELLGEWMTDEERYNIFRSKAVHWTTKKYGYTTPPSYEEYKIL